MTQRRKWGFLRETAKQAAKATEQAQKKGFDTQFTDLMTYLNVIFPETNDWICNKSVPGLRIPDGRKRSPLPDFRSESLKLIIEFDGLQHYTNPNGVVMDKRITEVYIEAGYKVVRIPYFIQLTNEVVEQMFGVEITEPLFDSSLSSMIVSAKNTPEFLCPLGIKRMQEEIKQFPQQLAVNLKSLKEETEQELAGVKYLIGI